MALLAPHTSVNILVFLLCLYGNKCMFWPITFTSLNMSLFNCLHYILPDTSSSRFEARHIARGNTTGRLVNK